MPVNSLLLNRANSAMISHDYALAARLYKSLIDENPDDKDLLVRLGNVYIKSGEDEKALPVFQKLLEADSQNAGTLLTLGGIYRRIKKYDESVEVLNKALKAGAKEEDAYYNLGFTYRLMGKYEDAIDCFEVVVTLNPSDVLAYNHLGAIYELKGDHEGAILAYQKALKIDPNHPVLHLNLAKAYENSENVVMAIREYETALRYKPGWDEAYCDYTKLLLKLGRVKDAQNLAEQGIALNAHNAGLQSVLGDIYMAESDYESAEKSYADLIQTEGKQPSVLKAFAHSLEAQGKNVEALDAIRKARDAFPDDEQLLKQSASINLSAQKILEASRDIKELIDKDRNDLETLDLAGQYYICTNDERRAQKAYKKIESSDSKYKRHLTNASNRYKQKGDLEKAESYINRYLVSNPDDAKALVSLASIEERLGNMSKAFENYNKALAQDANNHVAKISANRLALSVGVANAPAVPKIETQEIQDEVQETDSLETLDEIEQIPQDEIAVENQVENQIEENEVEDEGVDDLNLFDESPLVEDDDELDFFGIVDSHNEIEVEENNLVNMNLLDEESDLDDELFATRENVSESSSKPAADNSERQDLPAAKPAPEIPIDASALAEKMAQMTESTQRVLEAASMAQLAAATAQMAAQQAKAVDNKDEAARKLEEEKEAARKAAEEAERKLAEEKAAAEEAARKLEEEKEAARKAAEEAEKKLAEEKAAAEEAAKKLAEEKAALEEAAKELKEEKEAFRKTLEEAMDDDEENASDEAAEDSPSLVPAVENILKDEDGERDFESQINLFKTLLALSESLPPKAKKEFMQSRERVTLEYLISTLEGEPGLLKTSSALRKSGALTDVASEETPGEERPMGELLETVVGDMKSLSQDLEEEDLSIALGKLADEILEKE